MRRTCFYLALCALLPLGRASAEPKTRPAQTSPPTATFPPTTGTPPSTAPTTSPGTSTTPPLKRTVTTPQGTVARPGAPPKSEVIKEGIQGGPLRNVDQVPEDTTELSVSGGAMLAGGNSRLGAVTGAFRFLVLRGASQLSGGAAANYARSEAGENQPLETTVENYQAALRYDYFISPPIAFFIAFVGRRDIFQGLALRTRMDPGVALFMVRDIEIRLWTELGYDLQNDVRTQAAIDQAREEGFELSSSELTQNGRLFLGYQQRIEGRLQFDAGIEYIRNFLDAERFRLNYAASLSTQVTGSLSIGVVAATLYDNSPLPGVEKLDVTTTINLVYSLF